MHFSRMLEGRRALILGGASAVGGAVARLFAQHGAEVALADRPGEATRSLLRENPELLAVEWDGTSRSVPGVCARVLEAFGFADILVGATDGYQAGALADVAVEDFWRMLDMSFYSTAEAFRALLPQMLERRRGELVLIAPDAGAGAAVAACSGALASFARNVSMDYIRYRVRANTVLYPLAGQGVPLDAGEPLAGRPEPADAANAALWYACDLSRFVLGESLPVDGALAYTRGREAARCN